MCKKYIIMPLVAVILALATTLSFADTPTNDGWLFGKLTDHSVFEMPNNDESPAIDTALPVLPDCSMPCGRQPGSYNLIDMVTPVPAAKTAPISGVRGAPFGIIRH